MSLQGLEKNSYKNATHIQMKNRGFIGKLFILVAFCFIVAGCIKNQMSISFDLPAEVNTPCRILYYASGKNVGMIRETVAEITQGKGEITLPQQYPGLIYFFSPSRQDPSAIAYAQRGDKLKITGENGNIDEWDITGNKITEEISEWRRKNFELLRGNNVTDINKAVSRYVEANPDSKSAAIILYVYYRRRDAEKEFYKLQLKLGKSVLDDSRLMSALQEADLFTSLPDSYSYPKEIVLAGSDGFADTLTLSKSKKSTLLIFNVSDNDSGIIPMDSIKSLLKRNQNVGMVELFANPDSMVWQRHLKQDTIGELKRLWLPLGVSDSLAIDMGIKRMPYYVLLSPEGKELYRGDDWKEAVKKFDKKK